MGRCGVSVEFPAPLSLSVCQGSSPGCHRGWPHQPTSYNRLHHTVSVLPLCSAVWCSSALERGARNSAPIERPRQCWPLYIVAQPPLRASTPHSASRATALSNCHTHCHHPTHVPSHTTTGRIHALSIAQHITSHRRTSSRYKLHAYNPTAAHEELWQHLSPAAIPPFNALHASVLHTHNQPSHESHDRLSTIRIGPVLPVHCGCEECRGNRDVGVKEDSVILCTAAGRS